jgi:hypothetical protein
MLFYQLSVIDDIYRYIYNMPWTDMESLCLGNIEWPCTCITSLARIAIIIDPNRNEGENEQQKHNQTFQTRLNSYPKRQTVFRKQSSEAMKQ